MTLISNKIVVPIGLVFLVLFAFTFNIKNIYAYEVLEEEPKFEIDDDQRNLDQILNLYKIFKKKNTEPELEIIPEPSQEFMGNEGADGGSDIALEFKASARKAIDYIFLRNDPTLSKLRNRGLERILSNVKVYVTQSDIFVTNEYVRQKSVAISIPQKNIIYINGKDWANIKDDNIKTALALHELLIFARLEETGVYTYTQLYLQKINTEASNKNNYSIECKLIKHQPSEKKKTTVAFGVIEPNNNIDFLSLLSPEDKTRVEVFYFNSFVSNDLIATSYKNENLVSQFYISSEPNQIPNSFRNFWEDLTESLRWELDCTRHYLYP